MGCQNGDNLIRKARDGDLEMDRHYVTRGSALICGLLMLTMVGCTTWSDERQKHYTWLYQKCMRGEHEPYTIHMNRNQNSPHPERCREEYNHYVGTIKQASSGVAVQAVSVMNQ